MYLDRCSVRIGGKLYTRVLLRESYRHQGKVKHRTIANLSNCSAQEIRAIELALKHKHDLSKLNAEDCAPATSGLDSKQPSDARVRLRQGLSIGAVVVLEGLARQLGIAQALGTDRQGRLALWQVIARAMDEGSRLSAVRLATSHACCDLLGFRSAVTATRNASLYSFSGRCLPEGRAIIGFVANEGRIFWQALGELFCQRDVGFVPTGQGNDDGLRACIDDGMNLGV
jgi:hypothetical protein